MTREVRSQWGFEEKIIDLYVYLTHTAKKRLDIRILYLLTVICSTYVTRPSNHTRMLSAKVMLIRSSSIFAVHQNEH